MKKVVLMTGVLAAGLAAAPVTAKADVAAAPQIQEGVIENATVATEKLLDLLNGLDYDLAALKKQIHDKTYSFVGMEDEAQKEAIDDIINIATQIEKSRQDFYTLKAKFDSNEITEEQFVKEVNEMIYHPVLTREQAQKNLVERYVHLDQDWKLFRGFQQKGDELWGKVMVVVNGTQYKGVDEIKDVFDKHEALNTAAKAYRTAYLANHENRTKVWNHSNDCHTDGKQCLVEAEGSVNDLYAKYLKAYEELDTLVKKYYTDQTSLKAKVDNVDPSTYTKSVDGIDTVEKAQKAANDFINTFNASSVADWEDYLTGEDAKAPAFKEEAEYVKRAEALIKALNDAVAEAKANEKAYQDGLKAIEGSQKDLDAIQDKYYNTPKENVTGYVYRALIDDLQTKINNEKNGLVDAWNNWDFTVATDPVNAVEYVADKDFNKVKGEIADLLDKIQKNETANDKIHEMTKALKGHYTELKNAVADYEDVSLSQYAADGLCAHGEYLGTTNLDKLLDEFIKTEQKKYDAIESDAYLKNETAEGPTAKKDALDHELEMTWNAIATDQCAKYLAKVEAEYNTKHAYCEGLDDVCNEVEGEGAPCNCTEEDREANPCGWCDATARGMHDAIETAKSEMDGKIQDWHFATDAKNHVAEVKTYKDDAFTAIENWVKTFEEADRLHDKNLDDLKVIVDKAVHNVHEVYADAKHDLDNYKEGDLAAANLWAQDKYGVDFKGYVQLLEELYETAQVAADDARAKHHFTDLKAVGTECDTFAAESDYRVAVQANKAAADANLVAIADLETLLNSVVISEDEVYPADYTTLDAKYQAISGAIDQARTDANEKYEAGKADEFILPTDIKADINALQKALVAAKKVLADNKEAYNRLYVQLAAAVEARTALDTELSAVAGEIYAADQAVIDDLVAALPSAVTLGTKLTEELAAGTILTNEGDLADQIAALVNGVEGVRAVVAEKVAFKLKNVAAAQELTSLFQDLVDIVKTAPVGDVYASDAEYLEGKRDEVLGHINVEIGYIAQDLLIGKVVENRAQTMEGYQAMLDAVNGFQGQIKDAEKYLADSKAKAAELTADVNDLVVLLRSALPGDVYENIANDKDLEALYDLYEALSDDLLAENAAIATDLANRAILDNAAAHETAISALSIRVSEYQGKVKEYEQFKADNKATRDALINDLTNLLVTVDGLKKYGDVYEEGVEGGLDAYSIDRAIENLENAINGDLSFLKNIDYPAGEVLENVLQYKDGIETYKQDIESIKEQIADAEQLWAANYRALNNLEELIMAEKTVLENTKAMCACNECNVEDQAEVTALLTQLNTILGEVNDSFSETKDLAMQEGAFKAKVDDVKADAANLLALVQLHLDRVQSDLRAYNVLQKALEDVELWLANVELEDGWENFAERNAHCSNPDVKYLNELTTDVNDLKALIDQQHSHEGGHSCEEYKIDDMKAMKALIEDAKTLIAAIQANNAAYALINDRYDELYNDALAAYNFWHQYYAEQTLNDDWYTANKGWIQEWDGELEAGDYLVMLKNYFDDLYNHGNAAYEWTVDAQGKELKDAATETFEKQDTDLAKDRNDLAHKEALNHWQTVKNTVDTAKFQVWDEYGQFDYWTDTTTWDPFAANVMKGFNEEFEGEFGMIASLNTFKADIEAAYAEGVMEDAINIDEHNTALGIHQQLNGVLGVLGMVMEEYADLFAESHHLTNGKKIYSDQEYFTLGFFEKANDGSVENGQEMFKEVKVLVNDDIRLYDSRSYVWNDMGTPDDWSDDEALVDEKGRVVYDKENNAGEIAEVTVLTVGQKSNELSFNFHQNPMALERTTLKAGTAEVDFLPGSISVKNDNMAEAWTLKHTVSIDGIDVLAPEVAEIQPGLWASNGKLIVRVDNPIDLTYTINSLIARTDTGVEFSYADRELNYAAGQIEFTLPEGTQSVELPEGFFTFRTGENTIARSAACVVAVNNKTTSIDELVAMGEKAQIFDLQGRRVKAEALISGNTYVVNGEKKMVK